MSIVIAFMYIFGFKIFTIIDSTILVGMLLSIYMIFNRKYLDVFFKKIGNKNTVIMFIVFLGLISWSLIRSEIESELDLSYIKTLMHLIIVLIIGYEVVSFYELKNKTNKIVNYIIITFIIQSILQWIFFAFPDFSKYFNIFRSQIMIKKSVIYSGYRGIAITTSGFFALSSSYALVTVLYFTKYNTLFKNKSIMLKYFFFIIMFSGTLFAGRTGFIGLIYVIVLHIIKVRKKINFTKIFAILLIGILFIVFMKYTKNNKKIKIVYNYAFELINNYQEGKGFKSTSTDKLTKMYNIDFSTKTLLIGDGIYTVIYDGQSYYYKSVDIGYYRKILYFGFIGFVLSLILQYYIICNNGKRKENIAIMLLLFVFELKGEIIGICIIINSILILYSHSKYLEEEEINYGER